jgi:hypothetical protein
MISPESKLHEPTGKLAMPPMPGLMNAGQDVNSNPFSGIRRAGQAKRAMNFEKWQKAGADGANADKASFDGAKNQAFGGQAKTQFGAMRQAKF